MRALERSPLLCVFMAVAAAMLAMGLTTTGAWAAPADQALVADGINLQAQDEAAAVDVYVTVSNKGVLAIAREKLTVSDLNKDGTVTFDEAMQAAHEKYCPTGKDGYATAANGYGLQVTKLWGVDSTANMFYKNDKMADNVEVETVAAGDDLVAGVMKDQADWSDCYACFDKKEIATVAGDEFALTLAADSWGTVLKAPNVKVGTWKDGEFAEITGKTTDADGNVALSFDKPGTYVVSAEGTVAENSYGQKDCQLFAPVCVVSVAKAANTLTVSAVAAKNVPAATFGAAKKIAANKAVTVKNAKGAVTYKKASGNAKITVAKNGTITVAKGIAAGTYKVTIAVTAAGNEGYKPATKNATVTLSVKKAQNPMKVTVATKSVKLASVKTKAQTVAPIKVTKVQGTKAFKVTRWTGKAKSYIKVNAKNGKVTVKKGTPKGTYKFKVKITAKGNKNYLAKKVTKRITVKVA